MIQRLLNPLCITIVLQFISYRLTTAEPTTDTTINATGVKYYFYDHNYQLMDEKNLTISGNKSLIVFVHGFRSSPQTGVVADLGKSLVQWTNSNVVLVDWSKWTQKLDYMDVVLQLPAVGTYLFDWLNSLCDRGIVQSLDDVTLIGHSLGAQLIGYTGHRLNGTIKRVIALEPAQPNFKESHERVDVDSGQFVMVLHTSTMLFGMRQPVGHVDFYFNGGQIQPSCNFDTICGHIVVLNYLTDSLKNPSEFTAYRCHTLNLCEKHIVDITEPIIYMNINLPNSCEVITLSALNGCINIQMEINNFIKKETIKCTECDSNRKITINMKSHILIELVSIPQGLELSTSDCSINDIDEVHQNYAGEVMMTADEIPKTLLVNSQTYFLRGGVVFTSGNRAGLRVTSGHYKAYSYRTNDRWEIYDDLKESVQQYKHQKNNFELLLYTK